MLSADVVYRLWEITELSWAQVADILRTTEAQVKEWISEKPLSPEEDAHLQRVFDVVKRVDRGWNADNEALFLTSREGKVPVEMLRAGEYEQVVALLGKGPGRKEYPPTPDKMLHPPLSPDVLIGALHDRPYPACGPAIASYPIVGVRRR